MTEQTPLDRLDEAIEEWGEAYTDLHSYGGELCHAAITYRHYAEARIKELEADADEYKDVIKTANQTALDYMDKYKKAQAKLKAWEDASVIVVGENAHTIPTTGGLGAHISHPEYFYKQGTYHLKPEEADDEVV